MQVNNGMQHSTTTMSLATGDAAENITSLVNYRKKLVLIVSHNPKNAVKQPLKEPISGFPPLKIPYIALPLPLIEA